MKRQKQLKENMQSALQYLSKGNFKKLLRDYKGALASYNQAIDLHPKCAEAYYKRGNLKVLLEDIKGAEEDFNKAIELKSDFAEAFNNRGIIKLRAGDEKGSKLDFLRAARHGCFTAFEVRKEFCR